jgi:arylamine N-acetyltransferase
VRHQRPGTPEDYARAPAAFFRDALALGTGGTCFESNGALRALLAALGFRCEMAFCDMEYGSTSDPHCAPIVRHEGARYLADVGFPVPAALRLDEREATRVRTPVYTYHARPINSLRWEVRRRSGLFEDHAFYLKRAPIDDDAFRARLLRDHQPDGLFLDEVIIHKTRSDHMLRYSEGKGLIRRVVGWEEPVPLSEEEEAQLPETLARIFAMNGAVLRAALTRTPLPDPPSTYPEAQIQPLT